MLTIDRQASPPAAEAAFGSLIKTYGLLRRVMEPYFARFGISGSQWGVLRALQRAQKQGSSALRLRDLGERLVVRPPSVSGVVDRLQQAGLVQRGIANDDHRAKQVRLSPKGHRLIRRVERYRAGQIQAVLGGLSEKDQEVLRTMLDRLSAHLSRLQHDPGVSRDPNVSKVIGHSPKVKAEKS